MKSFFRTWSLAVLAVFAAMVASQAAAGIIYNVVAPASSSPAGWSLTGSIESPDVGTQYPGEWVYSITASNGSKTVTFTELNSNVYSGGNVIATDNSLYLSGDTTYISFSKNEGNYLTWATVYVYWVFGDQGNNPYNVDFSPGPTDGTVIAATAAAVPEIDPAMGSSSLSLVAGVLAMIEQRRRRLAAGLVW